MNLIKNISLYIIYHPINSFYRYEYKYEIQKKIIQPNFARVILGMCYIPFTTQVHVLLLIFHDSEIDDKPLRFTVGMLEFFLCSYFSFWNREYDFDSNHMLNIEYFQ